MKSLFRRSMFSLCALLMLGAVAGCSEDSVAPLIKNPLVSGPGSVNFGTVALGSCKDTTIRYDNTTGKSITLSSVTFAGAGFEWTGSALPVDVAAGSSIDLKVRYCPVSKDSSKATLVFKGTGGDDVTVNLIGFGVEYKPVLNGPARISFNPTAIGDCKDTTVRYDNTTGAAVTNLTFTISGPGASLFEWIGAPAPISVAAGGSIDVKIRYCPSAVDSALAMLTFVGIGGQSVSIALSGTGTEEVSNGPTVGSTYLFDTYETDGAGAKVVGTEASVEAEIVQAEVTYKGKSTVFIVSEEGLLSYYALESNGDISVYVDGSQGGPFGALVAGWTTLPYGSKRTNVTLLTKDTTINDSAFPVPITASIKQTASYAGESTIKINGTTYVVENVTLTTTVDLVALIIPVGNITNTVQAGFIRAIGFQANFDSQLESTVQGLDGGGSRKKLKSFVKK